MKRLAFTIAVLTTLALTNVTGQADGWVPLFNGKDLSGWTTQPSQPGNWRVGNGVLIGSGSDGSHLYSQGVYKDFHLRAEVRINDQGNSGIFVRTSGGPIDAQDLPRGYEAQINSTQDNPRTGSLIADGNVVIDVKKTRIAPGEWFTLEVIAQADRLVVKVNGRTTADYTDELHRFKAGHIVLQQWQPHTRVEFRKIEIKGPGIVQIAEKKPADRQPALSGVLPQEEEMLKLINNYRVENGLAPLKINRAMCLVARAHSENMARQNKMDHVLDDKGPTDRAQAAGLRGGFGENIAAGSRGAVSFFFQLWVDSPGHKANMLGDYAEMGVGFATGPNGSHWYTTLFGGRQ